MCIAFTRQSPSLIPLSVSAACTSAVMFTNPRRRGRLNHSSLRKLFIRTPLRQVLDWVSRQRLAEPPNGHRQQPDAAHVSARTICGSKSRTSAARRMIPRRISRKYVTGIANVIR